MLSDDIANQLLRDDGKLNSAVTRRDKFKESTLYKSIVSTTAFLDRQGHCPTISERVYCVMSNITSIPTCIICGNPSTFLTKAGRGYSTTCSIPRCKSNTVQRRLRRNSTMMSKYGALVSPKTVLGARDRASELTRKGRKTMMDRYGVCNPSQLTAVKFKKQATCLRTYGVLHPSQSPVVRQRIVERNQIKYGVNYPQQTQQYKQRVRDISLVRYGTSSQKQKHNPDAFNRLKDYQWLYHQYITLSKPARLIADELGLAPITPNGSTVCRYLHHHGFVVRRIQSFSFMAVQWLENEMKSTSAFIQHAMNLGEFTIPDQHITVDGFCSDTNTIYEFHGDVFHGNPKIFAPGVYCHPFDETITAGQLYQRTKDREDKIISLGYSLVVMWESDWKLQSSDKYTKQPAEPSTKTGGISRV